MTPTNTDTVSRFVAVYGIIKFSISAVLCVYVCVHACCYFA